MSAVRNHAEPGWVHPLNQRELLSLTVRVGGAAFLCLSALSLSLSRSLALSLFRFPELVCSPRLAVAAAGRSAVLTLLRCAALLRLVDRSVRSPGSLRPLRLYSCRFFPSLFPATFKMSGEKRVRRVKLVGVWDPSRLRAPRCLVRVFGFGFDAE